MSLKIWIGIDGGGTHSVAAAVRPDGRVAAVLEGGGLNYHNDGIEAVRLRLEELVRGLCASTGAAVEKVCVGMSALDGPADAATLACFTSDLLAPGVLDLQSDAYTALMGLTLGQPGMIVICGTGSMLLLMDAAGSLHPAGGWGYLLGDAGSGYTLAREAVMAVAAESDGLGPAGALTGRVLDFFGVSEPRELIPRIYDPACMPDRLAALARCVLEEAAAGDLPARTILSGNMERLAELAAQLLGRFPEADRTGLYGGIFAHSPLARQLFSEALSARISGIRILDPEFPPELGAVIHLLRLRGPLDPGVLARMKQSYAHHRRE